jgi:hypothetical protein
MQPLDQIFLAWSQVVNPSWIVLLFGLTVLHSFLFTFIDNWL